MTLRLSGAVTACALSLGIAAAADAAVIDAYFGMNVQSATAAGSFEVQLLSVTYDGGSGLTTATMPAFSAFTCTSEVASGAPCNGIPDIVGTTVSATPTYTQGGDGETSRTIGQTVPIDWDMSGPIPTITIYGITVSAVGAIWTAESSAGYTVGLIPFGSGDTELESFLATPQGDIYGDLAGVSGNPVGTFVSTSVSDSLYESLVGTAFGDFSFAAAKLKSPNAVPTRLS